MPLKGPPAAHGEVFACRAPGRDGGHRTAGLAAAHGHQIDGEQLPDLLGDGREHRLGGFAPGHQRGHPPQRGLLLGQLTQPRLIGRIPAHLPVRGTGAWRVHKATVTRCLAGSNERAAAFMAGVYGRLAGQAGVGPNYRHAEARAAVHGVWPRIRPIARADSFGFTKNPAAGLSAISSVQSVSARAEIKITSPPPPPCPS